MHWVECLQNGTVDECGVSGGLAASCAVAVQVQLQMLTLSDSGNTQTLQVSCLA